MREKLSPAKYRMEDRAALLLALTIFFALVIRAWSHTWDDSGITLAFAKNLAKYGDVVPTPLNSRVEGYSSFLWMLLNSLFFRLGFDENVVLTLAKVLATGFTLANILFFWRLITNCLHSSFYRLLALLLFAVSSISAAKDGMETALYAFLVLSAYFLYQKRQTNHAWYISFTLISSLLVLVRHEGLLFLAPFIGETLLQRKKAVLKEPFIYFWAVVVLGYHFWHYTFFGELLTNPMMAKKHWPYHPGFDSWELLIAFYLYPFYEFISQYIFVFICIPAYYLVQKKLNANNINQENWQLIKLFSLVYIVITAITGSNWGAAARLSYPGLAFILVFLFSKIDSAKPFSQSKIIRLSIVTGLLLNAFITYQAAKIITPYEITLGGVEQRASILSAVKMSLGKHQLVFAGVDMGGLLLYHSDGLKVIDLGLLCDRELAKNGYAHYNKYLFEQTQPEIIEAHAFWLKPLRETTGFWKSYFPVLVMTKRGEQIFYIRKDIIEELKSKYMLLEINLASTITDDLSQQTLADFGGYLILDLRKQ